MPPATPTLVCKQCGFGNEPERVYCHNCGAKLDRSLLPPEATKREDPVAVQGRLKKMTNPKRGTGLRRVKTLGSCLVISVVLAWVILLLRPPEGIPELNKDEVYNAATISDDMENTLAAPGAHQLPYTAKQVNAFLAYSIRGKEENVLGFIPMKFERAFVQFSDGVCRIYAQQSIFGYSLYANGAYTVKIEGNKIVATNLGGGIGRLRFPALAAGKLDDVMFARFWKATERDQKLLARMQSVTFRKDAVVMVTKSTQ